MNSVKTNNLSFYNDNGIISLSAKQYDTGRKFIFRIVDNGEPFDLTGCDVYLRIFKADKTQFQGEGCCTIEDNNIIVDTSLGNGDQILASDGRNICELHLTGPDGKSLTTWNFVINVEPRVHNGDNIDSIDSWDAWDHVKETAEDFNRKLEEHYFVLTLDKDVAGGVPSLDNNVKVPISELYEATTSTKGITQLTDSVTSESTTTAATPNSVKAVNDELQEEIKRAENAESDLDSRKADVESATLTGIPKAPTASAGTNTTQIATTAFVQSAVANLVDSAPETMDTLDELAKALGDDPNFATTVATQIGTKANTSDLTSHTDNKSNPHEVTKAQVGLGNVPNVSTDDQTPTFTETTSLSKLISGEKLSVAFGKISKAVNDLIGHIANKSNPHGVTKSQVGLENVENKSSATIRGELTKDNVISALGYTPSTTDATTTVTGVKGEKEEQYRAGNVSLSPADIGAPYAHDVNIVTIKIPNQQYSLRQFLIWLANTYGNTPVMATGNFSALKDNEAITAYFDPSKGQAYASVVINMTDLWSCEVTIIPVVSGWRYTRILQGNIQPGNCANGTFANDEDVYGMLRPLAFMSDIPTSLPANGGNAATVGGLIGAKKYISENFQEAFRTQTKGNSGSGDYFSIIRSLDANVTNAPQWGTGLAIGSDDTQAYLYASYSGAGAYIGGGNKDKLNWVKQIAFTDSKVAGCTNADSANRATADGNGNNLVNTYAKRSLYGDSEVSVGRIPNENIGTCSFAFGKNVRASGSGSVAFGNQAYSSGEYASAIGQYTRAHGDSSHAEGYGTLTSNFAMSACGKYNRKPEGNSTGGSSVQTGDVFVIGNGYEAELGIMSSNALRVTYTGDIYGTKAFKSSGADYAEFIKPWADGNTDDEDRVGFFVTVRDGFLYKAESGDYIAGITSGNPSIVGNADEDYYWRYERDAFNRIVMENAPETVQKTDENGNPVFDEETHEPVMIETGEIIKNARMKLADGYDPSLQENYVERKDRKEWDYVGMLGVLPVRDDGTCIPGQFCKCGEGGIATFAEERGFNTYFVIERKADGIVSVLLR